MNKPKTKYDCLFYEAKGGHCKKKSYNIRNIVQLKYGCKYPNDISKCPYTINKKSLLY